MIVYVNFEVSNFERSTVFYDAFMKEVGAKRIVSRENRLMAWGKNYNNAGLTITPKHTNAPDGPAHGAVVALEADSKEDVERIFNKGVELGASIYLPITLNDRGSYSGCIKDFDGHVIRIMCITA